METELIIAAAQLLTGISTFTVATLLAAQLMMQKKQLEMFAVCDRKISFIIDADEIKDKPKAKGKVAKLERVIMERGTYPREWKTK